MLKSRIPFKSRSTTQPRSTPTSTSKSAFLQTKRHFSNDFDTGSAVSTPRGGPSKQKQQQKKPTNNQTRPKSPHSNPLQNRYEQLQQKTQSQQPQHRQSAKSPTQAEQTSSKSTPRQTSPKVAQSPPPSSSSTISIGSESSTRNHRLATNDFDTVFKNSRLTNLFTEPQNHQSFWSRMEDGDTVHLTGTRRLVDPHGSAQETTFCLVQRTLDKKQNQILDRYIALDYDSGMPFEQYLTTSLEPDGSNGTAIDRDQESGEVIARTFLRLRGDPWKWHSAIAMSKIEPRIKAHMSQEYIDSLPDTYAVSRTKFTENGFLTEKMIRQNDLVVLTVIDDLKVTTKKIFEARVDKIFADYSKMLQEQIEQNAEEYEEGQDEHLRDDPMLDFANTGGSGGRNNKM